MEPQVEPMRHLANQMGWLGGILGEDFWSQLQDGLRAPPRPRGAAEGADVRPSSAPAHPQVAPPLEIYLTGEEVVLCALLPGLTSPEHVCVHLTSPSEVILEAFLEPRPVQGTPILRERFHGYCNRTVTLPAPVSTQGARVRYADGVLDIRLPRANPGAGPGGVALLHVQQPPGQPPPPSRGT